MTDKRSVAILYGFGEGPWHGRGLRSELLAAGFSIVNTPETADIIIAHSGGMYDLPTGLSGKAIFLIAPSCGSAGKTWFRTQSKKVWLDMRFFARTGMLTKWIQKSFWNAVYLAGQSPRLPHLWRTHRSHTAGLKVTNANTIVVTFRDDPWSGYMTTDEIEKHADYVFIGVDAIHDDIWLRPEVYANLARIVTTDDLS